MLKTMPDAKVSRSTVGGREVTYAEYGAWPVWFYATGDLVFQIVADQTTLEKVLAVLP